MSAPYLIAQITDLHVMAHGKLVSGIVDTAGALEHCVDALLAAPQRADLVVITGDLVESGAVDEYRLLHYLLQRLPMPVRLLPGNHDSRSRLREVFTDHEYLFVEGNGEDPVHYGLDAGPLRLVAFDCTIPGENGGRVEPDSLPWLESTLAASAQPTLLLMHHPPFITGIAEMDSDGLENAAALEAVVRRHPQVERVLCGHLHRHIVRRFGATIAIVAPSTAHQIVLDVAPGALLRFRMEPPGYLLHWWHPDHGLVTHAAPIEDYGPEYSY